MPHASTRSKQSKADYAYTEIRKRILSGEYGPGSRLVINTLARTFNVSALPVREAIRRLEAEGWVAFERNVGAQVARLDSSRLLETTQVLAVLEGYATARAAERLGPADLERAKDINRRMADAVARSELVRAFELNNEFHDFVLSHCGNAALVTLMAETRKRQENMSSQLLHAFYAGAAPSAVAAHERLLQLIESDAPPLEIEMAARQHRLDTAQAFDALQMSPQG